MNVVEIKQVQSTSAPGPKQALSLFSRMTHSLNCADVSLEKRVRLARAIAPLLRDEKSNQNHMDIVMSKKPISEKVIALLMMGFPKNRLALPFLQSQLYSESESLQMAAALAIANMRDGDSKDLLLDILAEAYEKANSSLVKKTLRSAMLACGDKRTVGFLSTLLKDRKPNPHLQ